MRLLNKIRDLIYDLFSTIMILGVLALALALVYNRVDHLIKISKETQASAPDRVCVQTEKAAPITVTLPQSATADQVADILLSAGLIQDADAFTARLNELGLNRIHYGDHQLQPGLSDRDLIEALSQPQP